jgi:hypothetical protein
LLGYGLGCEFQDEIGHDVRVWSFALERRLRK